MAGGNFKEVLFMPGIKMLPGETMQEYSKHVKEIVDGLDDLDTRHGHIVARYPSKYRVLPYAVDELTGILKGDYDLDEVKAEAFREKYALAY